MLLSRILALKCRLFTQRAGTFCQIQLATLNASRLQLEATRSSVCRVRFVIVILFVIYSVCESVAVLVFQVSVSVSRVHIERK